MNSIVLNRGYSTQDQTIGVAKAGHLRTCERLICMTWLAFIASMVGSLSWPVVIAILALSFRKQVTSVIPRLTKAKAFGGELEFSQALDKAENLSLPPPEHLKSGLPPSDKGGLKGEGVRENFQSVETWTASIGNSRSRLRTQTDPPPEYRIISAWKYLYSVISDAASKKGLNVRGFLSNPEIREIGPAIGLSPDQIRQVNELRNLRNRAANEPDWTLTVTDALRYEDLVLSLIASIEGENQMEDGRGGSS